MREADHSAPSSAEVPQYTFMVWCSVKAQAQFYLTFTFIRHN